MSTLDADKLLDNHFPQWAHLGAQLHALHEELLAWNARVNLVSRKDTDKLWAHHLLHSLCVASYWQPQPNATVLDIGCGGGLPGLPLAICYPQVQFTLLDSTRKKITAVEEMAAKLGLDNVQAVWQRAEEHRGMYDYVLGRAVTALPAFYALAKPRMHTGQAGNLENGILYLKGGEFLDELREIPCKHSLFHLHNLLPIPFFETKFLVHIYACK